MTAERQPQTYDEQVLELTRELGFSGDAFLAFALEYADYLAGFRARRPARRSFTFAPDAGLRLQRALDRELS